MSNAVRIAHLTSAHPRDDVRIFLKMCSSLATAGYETILVVADGKGDDVVNGVSIIDVGAPRSRLERIFSVPRRILKVARTTGAALFHLHDPELLLLTWELKNIGRVIFDSHEDAPKQMLSKPYLPQFFLRVLATLLAGFERLCARRLSAIITATPAIRRKFEKLHQCVVDINNYPLESELVGIAERCEIRKEICYVGAIAEIRGIVELCEALGKITSDVTLNLIGAIDLNSELYQRLCRTSGWSRVTVHGHLDRAAVRRVMARSFAGIVTFHPVPNHIEAQPNKMFEYMSAGIAVIASDFPLWRAIIDGADCGLLVNPNDPESIAAAIDRLARDRSLSERLGQAGRRAVASRYNWQAEQGRLLEFYQRVLTSN